ncbi:protein HSH49-like isoform X2 [Sesamum indicum]|uniref:Protein HSH49-like isoform X2 n=1 Tax=Sesamum indicum TaxID=4182 RepID=A0A8M8UXC2_SESIN|nr:protein HSH49-like isoform X2 [Sesamum indicum]
MPLFILIHSCTGNLDERVGDRVLYDILIQAGPVMNLYIPRDKETDKPKGYAFAQYETEEVAEYAVKLFSGLVTLYKRTLKFAMNGFGRHLKDEFYCGLKYICLG